MPHDALNLALEYASWGWRIFPLLPRDKKPFPGSHGFADATTDPAIIRDWWTRTPQANIGLATGPGSGVIVVDLDVDPSEGKDGIAEWRAITADKPAIITCIAQTGRPGRHLFFLCDNPIVRNRVLSKSIDIRGDGGYVVLPGSIHPNGNEYKWIDHPESVAPAPLPDWLLPKGNLVGLVDATATARRKEAMEAFERCERYVATLPPAISGQGGHSATLRVAAECFRFGLTESQAWDILSRYNTGQCQPAWSEKELRHKLREGKKLVDREGKFGHRLDEGNYEADWPVTRRAVEKITVAACSDIPKADELEVFDMADVIAQDVPWLWKGRITLGGMTIIAGSPSAGKGTLTADLAARITKGSAWPDGSDGPAAGSVIFISGEDEPAFTLKPRLMAAGADLSHGKVKAAKTIKVYRGDGSVRVRGFNVADIPPLERLLHQTPHCRAVFIDPIGDFLDGAVNSDKDNHVREVLQPLDLLAKNFNVAMVLVCHTRKASSPKADDLILGSRAFSGMPRNVWHVLKSENDEQRFLLSGKSNLAKQMDGLSFVVEGVAVDGCKEKFGAVKWSSDPVPMNATQWLAEQSGEGQTGPKPEKRKEAEAFIRGLLDEHIVIASAEVDRLAEEQDIKHDTLKAAKKRLRVASFREGEGRSAPWFIYADQRPIIKQLIASAEQRREGPSLSQQVNAIIAATSLN